MSNFPNPFYAFVELWIGEVNISLLPPQNIQQFTYTRKPCNSANKFIISLFDETALLVESQLVKGWQDIRFKYGYANGAESPVYSGIVTEYDVDFNPTGAVLTIEGLSDSVSTFSTPKSDTYADMTIDQIVKQIAYEEGWTPGIIVACEPVSDGVNANKTFTRTNQNSQVFIINELIPYAKSSETGDSNYVLNFEDKNGDTIVNFYPIVQAATRSESTTHSYEFQWGAGNAESKVIEFNPDYSGTLCLVSGGGTVDSSTIDKISNCMVNMRFTNTDDANRVVLADRSGYDYNGAVRYIGGSSQSYDEMKKSAAYLWYVNSSSPVTAEMTIMGDPLINAFDTISIVMLNKDGLPHHSSGLYCIKEVEDDIVGGSFLTKLILFRNAMNIGVNEAGGVDVNLVADLSIDSVTDIFDQNSNIGNSGAGNNYIVEIALQEEGIAERSDGTTKYSDWYANGFNNSDWGAMFVAWCAEHAGISNNIIPRLSSCSKMYDWFRSRNQWVSAPSKQGPAYAPKAGDIIIIGWNGKESADQVGIVIRSDENNVYVIEGNSNSMVEQCQYLLNDSNILGYGIPAYPSTQSSADTYVIGNSNEETIYYFLIQSMGLNCAAACGILANIEHESNFNPNALGDNNTSFGICQWHASRYSNLMTWCSNNNLDYKLLKSQLSYLNHELNSEYSNLLKKLRTVPNTSQGAYDAASYWCLDFERPANSYAKSKERGDKSRNTYYPKYKNKTVPTTSTSSNGFVPRFTKPEAGNPYYNTKSKGGYSDAIVGSPTDSGCNVLSNCVGYAYGRFNEIGGYGSCKYLTSCNAENFIENRGNLSVGMTPKLGACMVWRKGATLSGTDGPGHVAIVEKIISDTEIITSESGWECDPFWTKNRKKGDGNWGYSASSGYTFLGFIYNPAVS